MREYKVEVPGGVCEYLEYRIEANRAGSNGLPPTAYRVRARIGPTG